MSGSVDQVTTLTTKRVSMESRDTEKILNLLKASNKQTKKNLKQIDSILSASSPNVKKSWCLWMEAPVFVEVLPGPVIPDDHTGR